jgi:hypothetical protein
VISRRGDHGGVLVVAALCPSTAPPPLSSRASSSSPPRRELGCVATMHRRGYQPATALGLVIGA